MDKNGRKGKYSKINGHPYEKYSKDKDKPRERQWIADFVKQRNQEIADMKKFPKPKPDDKVNANELIKHQDNILKNFLHTLLFTTHLSAAIDYRKLTTE